MELSPLLQHFVDVGFRVGEDQLREGKEVCPQITLLAEDKEGLTIVPIMIMVDILGSKDGRQVASRLVRNTWENILNQRPKLKLLAITLMADIWMKSMTNIEVATQLFQGTFKPPSSSVGSTECIIVQLTLENEDGMYEWPYVRSGEEVVFSAKPKKREMHKALFTGLWPI